MKGVKGYREPHFWGQNSSFVVGTLHIQVEEAADEQDILAQASKVLRRPDLGVKSLSIQVEKSKFVSTLPPHNQIQYHAHGVLQL
jgi:Co/Zn/Cd efflux system component